MVVVAPPERAGASTADEVVGAAPEGGRARCSSGGAIQRDEVVGAPCLTGNTRRGTHVDGSLEQSIVAKPPDGGRPRSVGAPAAQAGPFWLKHEDSPAVGAAGERQTSGVTAGAPALSIARRKRIIARARAGISGSEATVGVSISAARDISNSIAVHARGGRRNGDGIRGLTTDTSAEIGAAIAASAGLSTSAAILAGARVVARGWSEARGVARRSRPSPRGRVSVSSSAASRVSIIAAICARGGRRDGDGNRGLTAAPSAKSGNGGDSAHASTDEVVG